MNRRAIRMLLLVAAGSLAVGLMSGCEQGVVLDTARSSISSFLNGIFNAAVQDALFPNR